MWTLANFGEYKRKFMKITQFLINGRFLSELDRNAYFPKGLPANLETQVQYRLLITNTAHHPSNPYPIADTAAVAVKTGSTPRNSGVRSYLTEGRWLHCMWCALVDSQVPDLSSGGAEVVRRMQDLAQRLICEWTEDEVVKTFR